MQANHNTTETEEWRPILDFPGYLVSSLGRVASDKRRTRRILSPCETRYGYLQVLPWCDGRRLHLLVHRAVARAFIGECPEGMETRHLDGSRTNNAVSNLAYGTKSENMLDQVRHGTHAMASKKSCNQGHPYDEVNTYVRPDGSRACRTCRANWHRAEQIARTAAA